MPIPRQYVPRPNEAPETVQHLIELVDKVRKSRNKKTSDIAFEEIVSLLDTRVKQISYKIKIPGTTNLDIYQEALYALRFKAIKDYDHTRGSTDEPYPFDRFAVLCIRRHLSTKRKAAYQYKQRALNTGISLDQDQNRGSGNSGEHLFLADILPASEGSIIDSVESHEYFKKIFTSLLDRLSDFEKEVIILYAKRYSYDEISHIINKRRKSHSRSAKIGVKSIDNALSRIKKKSKGVLSIFDEKTTDDI